MKKKRSSKRRNVVGIHDPQSEIGVKVEGKEESVKVGIMHWQNWKED